MQNLILHDTKNFLVSENSTNAHKSVYNVRRCIDNICILLNSEFEELTTRSQAVRPLGIHDTKLHTKFEICRPSSSSLDFEILRSKRVGVTSLTFHGHVTSSVT